MIQKVIRDVDGAVICIKMRVCRYRLYNGYFRIDELDLQSIPLRADRQLVDTRGKMPKERICKNAEISYNIF